MMWWLLWCDDSSVSSNSDVLMRRIYSQSGRWFLQMRSTNRKWGRSCKHDVSSSYIGGDHWMYAKEDPRKLPWKILPTMKPGDLKPLGGVERLESRTLLCRLIAQSSFWVPHFTWPTHSSQDLNNFSIRVFDLQEGEGQQGGQCSTTYDYTQV